MWKRIYKDVPDAVVVEGPEAGGHLGVAEDEIHDEALKIEHVVPEVRETLAAYEKEFGKEIPVIAAGGIFTGEDMYRIMKLGASGVQMGTRFVATDECDADVRFKEAYVTAKKEDIGIIKSPVGLPGRAIVNTFLTKAAESRRTFKCPWQCLAGCQADKAHYCISLALNNARQGKLEQGFVFVGSNAYRVESIVPVRELVEELEAGYMKALFADMKGLLAGLIERIHELKKEYRRLEITAARLKKEYEEALTAKIRSVGNTGATALREEYRKVSARLTELQLNMTERVFDTFEILMKGSRV
jgi:nitronate monooxygenase